MGPAVGHQGRGGKAHAWSVPHLSLGGDPISPTVQTQMAAATRAALRPGPHPDPDAPSERDRRPLHPSLGPSNVATRIRPPGHSHAALPPRVALASCSQSPAPSSLLRLSANATSSRKPFLVPPSLSSSLTVSPRLSPAAPPLPVTTWSPGLGGLPSPLPSRGRTGCEAAEGVPHGQVRACIPAVCGPGLSAVALRPAPAAVTLRQRQIPHGLRAALHPGDCPHIPSARAVVPSLRSGRAPSGACRGPGRPSLLLVSERHGGWVTAPSAAERPCGRPAPDIPQQPEGTSLDPARPRPASAQSPP